MSKYTLIDNRYTTKLSAFENYIQIHLCKGTM